MKFKNPSNDYVEEISDSAWFWVLLFGPFYFAVKGIWVHVFVGALLGLVTSGISWLIYPFFAEIILRKYYLSRGWIELDKIVNVKNKTLESQKNPTQDVEGKNNYGCVSVIFWSFTVVAVLIFFMGSADKKDGVEKNEKPVTETVATEVNNKATETAKPVIHNDKELSELQAKAAAALDVEKKNQEKISYKVIKTDINTAKNHAYYDIELAAPKDILPSMDKIESIYREVFDSYRKKFVATMYLRLNKKKVSTYAVCTKIPDSTNECHILYKDKNETRAIDTSDIAEKQKDSNELRGKDRSDMAFVQCTMAIKDGLKSPSTADFPSFPDKLWRFSGQSYVIKSYVDAQNSFGAVNRNNWHCKIQYTKGDEYNPSSWNILELEMF